MTELNSIEDAWDDFCRNVLDAEGPERGDLGVLNLTFHAACKFQHETTLRLVATGNTEQLLIIENEIAAFVARLLAELKAQAH